MQDVFYILVNNIVPYRRGCLCTCVMNNNPFMPEIRLEIDWNLFVINEQSSFKITKFLFFVVENLHYN